MKSGRTWLDPVTRKRLRRFREMKRAWRSLLALLALYGISLFSELLCNSQPLYVHCNGRSYFPVFRTYPDDAFTGSGKETRPDYKQLNRSPAFRGRPGNFMVFPPIPFGPDEIADPAAIDVPEGVVAEFTPELLMGSLNLALDWTIVRARNVTAFFGRASDAEVRGLRFTERWVTPRSLREAIHARLANRTAPRLTLVCPGRRGNSPIECRLSRFRPRRRKPTTVRVLLREVAVGRLRPFKVACDADGQPCGRRALENWARLPVSVRTALSPWIKRRLTAPVEDRRIQLQARTWRVSFHREEVRYPFHPVRGHWFGIDNAGRDVLARVLYGLRTSLTFGLVLVVCSMTVGVVFGAIQGYFGGVLDITCQRMIEIWAALPFLYIMILLGSVYGRSFALLIVCYGLFNWIGISYYVRAEFLRLRRLPFVEAARCIGLPSRKIIFRHILPNALVPVITFFPFSLVGAIGSLAALDYLGFGLPPPTASLGELLQQAQQFRWAWWLILYPSLALFVVMLLGVFIGEGVRNAYDPRRYSRME